MKLNHRLLITSGLLLAMSTVAMSTATYAWFTTTRESKITLNNVTIQQDSNLEMKVVKYNGETINETEDMAKWGVHSDLALVGKAVQDVSGDGTKFFKPNIASDGATFTSVKDVSAAATPQSEMYTYVHEIVLGFRSDKAYEVWLGSGTTIIENSVAKPGDSVNRPWGLGDCARVAFFDLNSGNTGSYVSAKGGTKTLTGVYAKSSESDGYNFITDTDAASTTVSIGSSYSNFTTYSEINPIVGEVENKINAEQNPNSFKVCTLALHQTGTNPENSSPVYETMKDPNNPSNFINGYFGYVGIRIWVEGTDANCKDDARYGSFSTELKFISYMAA